MSQAPDLKTIFDVETAINTAFKTVLENDCGIPAYIQASEEILPIPRVDISLELGAETGHFGDLSSKQPKADAWAATLVIEVITKRVRGDDGLHGRCLGFVRQAVQYASGRFGESVLPYHVLSNIRHANTQPILDDGCDSDVSVMQFACVISVRSNAWPAPSEGAGFIFGDAAGNPFGDAAGNQFGDAAATSPVD